MSGKIHHYNIYPVIELSLYIPNTSSIYPLHIILPLGHRVAIPHDHELVVELLLGSSPKGGHVEHVEHDNHCIVSIVAIIENNEKQTIVVTCSSNVVTITTRVHMNEIRIEPLSWIWWFPQIGYPQIIYSNSVFRILVQPHLTPGYATWGK